MEAWLVPYRNYITIDDHGVLIFLPPPPAPPPAPPPYDWHIIKGLHAITVNCDAVYKVPPQNKVVRWKAEGKGSVKNESFPALEIRKSTIPDAGCGLFAAQDIKKGGLITEYGGALLESGKHDEVFRGQRSHLMATDAYHGVRIDGRVFDKAPFRLEDYIARHEVMAFANSSRDKSNKSTTTNSDRKWTVMQIPDEHNNNVYRARMFLKATKPIKNGEEIFYRYVVE